MCSVPDEQPGSIVRSLNVNSKTVLVTGSFFLYFLFIYLYIFLALSPGKRGRIV